VSLDERHKEIKYLKLKAPRIVFPILRRTFGLALEDGNQLTSVPSKYFHEIRNRSSNRSRISLKYINKVNKYSNIEQGGTIVIPNSPSED
jgi:hypothetical protein